MLVIIENMCKNEGNFP